MLQQTTVLDGSPLSTPWFCCFSCVIISSVENHSHSTLLGSCYGPEEGKSLLDMMKWMAKRNKHSKAGGEFDNLKQGNRATMTQKTRD